jgi:hypothetical protein
MTAAFLSEIAMREGNAAAPDHRVGGDTVIPPTRHIWATNHPSSAKRFVPIRPETKSPRGNRGRAQNIPK